MNNLASLKSQLLLQYTEQSQNRSRGKTFYEHHNLPTRNLLRSSEGKHGSTSNKLVYQISQQKSGISKISSLSQQISGRNIFVNPEKEKLPGPGFYEPTIHRYSSFGYIKKEESHILSKAARRLKRKEFVNECRGPGSYSPQKAFNFTSKSHSAKQGSFTIGKITRSILPQQSALQIHLTSSTNFKKPERKSQVSPSSYDVMKATSKTSNFFNPLVHKISMTQRSNIARQNMRNIQSIQHSPWSRSL